MRVAVFPLAVALALSGCEFHVQESDATASEVDVVEPEAVLMSESEPDTDGAVLIFDREVSGELTSASPVNYSNGSRYQRFSLAMAAGQAAKISLTGPLTGVITVFRDGELMARGDGGSCIFRAADAGAYLVAVSGQEAGALGAFKLRAAEIAAHDGRALQGEGDVVDWLSGSHQDYVLHADRAGLYTVTLASAAFDPVLHVHGPGVDATNDDGGQGTDSRLRLYLEPGTYTLGVAAYGDEAQDEAGFTLGVGYAEAPDGVVTTDDSLLTPGQTVMASLDTGASRRFILDLVVDAQISLDVSSDAFDTVVEVQGPGGHFENDDGGANSDSRLVEFLPAGRYRVSVRAYDDGHGVFEVMTRIGDAAHAVAP